MWKLSKWTKKVARVMMLVAALWPCLGSPPALAEHVTEGSWNTVAVTLTPVKATPKIKLYLEGQARLQTHEPTTALERTLLWGGVGYQVTPKTSVWSGYAWTPSYNPHFKNENRLWQQVLHVEHPKGGELLLRGRVEERMIEGLPNTLVRLRGFVRYTHDFSDKHKMYWAIQNEILVNANAAGTKNPIGYNQNRAYVGVGRHINQHVNAEVGYMAVFACKPHGADTLEHVLMANITIR
jgi:hypothetical protein